MSDAVVRLVAIIVPALAHPALAASSHEPITGTAKVLDGGTIEITTKNDTVRLGLVGINAPGAAQRCLAGSLPWLCGAAASKHLAELIGRSQVTCKRSGMNADGRPVALCVANGRDLSEQMVRDGWAAADPQQGRDYQTAEGQARRAKTGIWQ